MYHLNRFTLVVASLWVSGACSYAMADNEVVDSNQGLEEVVVVAQRRSENIQRVPIAVTAIEPATIEQLKIETVQDVQIATTGLVFNEGIQYSNLSIRGIGSNNQDPGLENSVATYIDGAYLERAFGSLYDIVDPAGLEVLKGPQGTLWGRNATGGALVINTADPTASFASRAKAEIGGLGHELFDGMLNLPLTDTVSARFAARYREEGGYIRDLPVPEYSFGGQQGWTARAKLKFQPNDEWSAVVEYQYDQTKGSPDANTGVLPAAFCLACGMSKYTYPLSDPYTTATNPVLGGNGVKNLSDFYNLHVNYSSGPLTFGSVTAYRTTHNFTAADFDFTELDIFNLWQGSGSKTFTQDFLVSTDPAAKLSVVGGLDYLHDSGYYLLGLINSASGPIDQSKALVNYTETTKSVSGFAELRVRPVEALTISGGGRYTRDSRDGMAGNSKSFTSFTPRVVAAYEAGPVNTYVSYNKGYKAGGFTHGAAPIYQPEHIDSYEFGVKYLSSGDRVRANLAVFRYNYKDIQVLSVNQSDIAHIENNYNAGSARGTGFELEGEYKPIRQFRLFGGITYLDAYFTSFPGASVQVPVYDSSGKPTGFGTGLEDLTGSPLPNAPKWSGFLGATAHAGLARGWGGEMTIQAHHTGSYYFNPGAGGPLRSDMESAYTVTQASLRLIAPSEDFEIGAYVNNLGNTVYDNFRFSTAPFGALRDVARPRVFGVNLIVKF